MFRIIISLQSLNFINLWVFLELRTLRFIFFIASDKILFDKFQEIIKFFIIQCLSGLRILILRIFQELENNNFIFFILILIILLKIGSAPFHIWILNLSLNISWISLFLFLSLIKIIPFQFLNSLSYFNLSIFGLISFIISSILIIYTKNLKQILIISSIIFIGIIFFILNKNFWIEFLFIYSIILAQLRIIFWLIVLQKNFLIHFKNSNLIKIFLLISIFNIRGIPPLPGFFIKIFWLINSNLEIFSILIFLIISRLRTYIYIRIWINFLRFNSYKIYIKNNYNNFKNNFFLFIFIINFYISLIWFYFYYIKYLKQELNLNLGRN